MCATLAPQRTTPSAARPRVGFHRPTTGKWRALAPRSPRSPWALLAVAPAQATRPAPLCNPPPDSFSLSLAAFSLACGHQAASNPGQPLVAASLTRSPLVTGSFRMPPRATRPAPLPRQGTAPPAALRSAVSTATALAPYRAGLLLFSPRSRRAPPATLCPPPLACLCLGRPRLLPTKKCPRAPPMMPFPPQHPAACGSRRGSPPPLAPALFRWLSTSTQVPAQRVAAVFQRLCAPWAVARKCGLTRTPRAAVAWRM